jgi:hypothetical protein
VTIPWDHPCAPEGAQHYYAVSNYHTAALGDSIIKLNTKSGHAAYIETNPDQWL